MIQIGGGIGYAAATEFIDEYYGSFSGQAERRVIEDNVQDFLYDHFEENFHELNGLTVYDDQGGDGYDAIALAELGCEVVMLDKSDTNVEIAQENRDSLHPDIQKNLIIEQGGLDSTLLGNRLFDIVLRHRILPCPTRPHESQDQLTQLSARLKPGGVLSMVVNGYEANRAKLEGEALRAFDETDGRYINELGFGVIGYRPETFEEMVSVAGLRTIKKYGIGILSDDDRRRVDQEPQQDLIDVVTRELRASRDPDLLASARMMQFIAVKEDRPKLSLVPTLR